MWVKVVNRDKWELGDYLWICFDYFLYGWYGEDFSDDNYGFMLF